MTDTVLLNTKGYLTVISIISVGVLSGSEYLSPVLAVLLIAPVARLLIKKLICRKLKGAVTIDNYLHNRMILICHRPL